MELVGSGLRDDIDLRAAGGAALGGVDARGDAEFGDRIERDVQAGLGLLRLFLDAAGVDAVEREVAVVERVAVEANARAVRRRRCLSRRGRASSGWPSCVR